MDKAQVFGDGRFEFLIVSCIAHLDQRGLDPLVTTLSGVGAGESVELSQHVILRRQVRWGRRSNGTQAEKTVGTIWLRANAQAAGAFYPNVKLAWEASAHAGGGTYI